MEKRFEAIKAHFERAAEVFDRNFRRFAPAYEEAIQALVLALPFRRGDTIRVLDLGCGTGNITRAIVQRFPRASVTCIDLSEKMIEMARAKLKRYKNVEFFVGDLRDFKCARRYNAAVSSLALHHLEGKDKKLFYRTIYRSLVKGGVFYNADVTLGANKHLQNIYMAKWIEFLRKGCSPAEVKCTLENHKREDRPARLMQELRTLAEAGFKELDVVCKWYYCSVYGGVK